MSDFAQQMAGILEAANTQRSTLQIRENGKKLVGLLQLFHIQFQVADGKKTVGLIVCPNVDAVRASVYGCTGKCACVQ